MAISAAPQLQWQQVNAPNGNSGVRDLMGVSYLFDKAIKGFTDIADRRMDQNTAEALAKIKAADPTGLRTDIASQAYQDAVNNANGNLNLEKLQAGYDALDTRMQNNLNQFQDRNMKAQDMTWAEDARQAQLGLQKDEYALNQKRLDMEAANAAATRANQATQLQIALANANLQQKEAYLRIRNEYGENAANTLFGSNFGSKFNNSGSDTNNVNGVPQYTGTNLPIVSASFFNTSGSIPGSKDSTSNIAGSNPIIDTAGKGIPVEQQSNANPANKTPVITTTTTSTGSDTATGNAPTNVPTVNDAAIYGPAKSAEAPLAANVQAALNKAVDMQYSDDPKMQQMGRAMEQSLKASIAQSTAPVKTGYKGVDVEGIQNLAQAAKDKRAAEILANKSSDSTLDRIYGSAQENPVAASLTGALTLPAAIIGAGPEAITSAVAGGGGAILRNGVGTAIEKVTPYAEKVLDKVLSPFKGESLGTRTENAVNELAALKNSGNATPEAIAQAEAKAKQLTDALGKRDMAITGATLAGTAYGIDKLFSGNKPSQDQVAQALNNATPVNTTTPTNTAMKSPVVDPKQPITDETSMMNAPTDVRQKFVQNAAALGLINKDGTANQSSIINLLNNPNVDDSTKALAMQVGDVYKRTVDYRLSELEKQMQNPGYYGGSKRIQREINTLKAEMENPSGLYKTYGTHYNIAVEDAKTAKTESRIAREKAYADAGLYKDGKNVDNDILSGFYQGTDAKGMPDVRMGKPILEMAAQFNRKVLAANPKAPVKDLVNVKELAQMLKAGQDSDSDIFGPNLGPYLYESAQQGSFKIPQGFLPVLRELSERGISTGWVSKGELNDLKNLQQKLSQ